MRQPWPDDPQAKKRPRKRGIWLAFSGALVSRVYGQESAWLRRLPKPDVAVPALSNVKNPGGYLAPVAVQHFNGNLTRYQTIGQGG